jgi:hypothetical protein
MADGQVACDAAVLTVKRATIVDKPLRIMAVLLRNLACPVHEAGSGWRFRLPGLVKTGGEL